MLFCYNFLFKLFISSAAVNMKGKFTHRNLKVEINSDDRFVVDKSSLWRKVKKVCLVLFLLCNWIYMYLLQIL